MKRISLVIAAILLAAGKAVAVIPPLDDFDKLRQSTHIVEGSVEKADAHTEADRLGTRRVVTLTVKIDVVLKGADLHPGDRIDLLYWQAGKRPDRWVGDTGQRGSFAIGGKKRFFVHQSQTGYHLLSPDGSESLERRPTFPYKETEGDGWRTTIPSDWGAEPMSTGKGKLFWPPEGEAPTMSHVAIEPYPGACDPSARMKQSRVEVAGYLEGGIVREIGGRPGEPYEIEYRWKDDPAQPFDFVNIDRYVCSEGKGWRLRYATTVKESPTFMEAVQIMFRLFGVGP